MRRFAPPGAAIVLLCFYAAQWAFTSTLPGELAINPEAGRGGWLIVTGRLESGEEVPFVVDIGTSGTFFDKSLEPKLGEPIGTTVTQSWGVHNSLALGSFAKESDHTTK